MVVAMRGDCSCSNCSGSCGVGGATGGCGGSGGSGGGGGGSGEDHIIVVVVVVHLMLAVVPIAETAVAPRLHITAVTQPTMRRNHRICIEDRACMDRIGRDDSCGALRLHSCPS